MILSLASTGLSENSPLKKRKRQLDRKFFGVPTIMN
jgi:hypothetical protein